MSKQLLIRNVPPKVESWIKSEIDRRKVTQQEFLVSILEGATPGMSPLQFPLLTHAARPNLYKEELAVLPFKFVDLFAGIGGFRVGLERIGGECVFSSEWDKYAQKTYRAWFGETPVGDITKIKPADIPDHDILTAGFPCQPFSIAGVSKKNSLGRAHGFDCAHQGNLFFNVANIIQIKRPPVAFLENVKNLQSHDKGRTWQVIKETLETLGYVVFKKVIDASAWVPQHRERILIVCFDRKVFGNDIPFAFPEPPTKRKPPLSDILETNPDKKYTLSGHLWKYLQNYAKKHKEKGNGFGFGLANPDGITRTLSARYYKDGSEILIPRGRGRNPRRLTPEECSRLMGFDPKEFRIVVSDTQAYRQFGNAVVPPMIEAVGRSILTVLSWHLANTGNGCILKSTNGTSRAGNRASA